MVPFSRILTLTLVAISLIVMGCGATEDLPAHHIRVVRKERVSATLPYQIRGGRITLEVRINQSGRLHFILDTGAPVTTIFESARTTGFDQPISAPSACTISRHTAMMSGASMEVVSGLALTVGNATLEGLEVWQWPADRFFGRQDYDDVPYDGVIGYDLLRFVALEINRRDQTITLHDPDAYALSDEWTATSLEFLNNKPYCDIVLQIAPEDDPVAMKVHLDLGGAAPLWIKPDATKGLTLPEGQPLKPIGQWLSGDAMMGVAWPCHELRLFGHTLHGIPARLVPSGHPLHPDREGHIGEAELRHFDLLFDYSRNRVAARRVHPPFRIEPDALAKLTGRFESEDLPLTFEFSVRGGLLYVQPSDQGPLPLVPASEREFRFDPAGVVITFDERESGDINTDAATLRQNGRTFRLHRSL